MDRYVFFDLSRVSPGLHVIGIPTANGFVWVEITEAEYWAAIEDLEAAQAQVRALCRDMAREQEFRPHEGVWCGSCDFQEFYPAKAKNPRPVPAGGRARQMGFDFDG